MGKGGYEWAVERGQETGPRRRGGGGTGQRREETKGREGGAGARGLGSGPFVEPSATEPREGVEPTVSWVPSPGVCLIFLLQKCHPLQT